MVGIEREVELVPPVEFEPRLGERVVARLRPRKLRFVVGVGDRARPQPVAQREADVVRLHHVADALELCVEEAPLVVRQAPLGHDRSAARDDAGRSPRRPRKSDRAARDRVGRQELTPCRPDLQPCFGRELRPELERVPERCVVVDRGPRMKTGDGPGDQVAFGRTKIAARWIDPERPTGSVSIAFNTFNWRWWKLRGDGPSGLAPLFYFGLHLSATAAPRTSRRL